MGSDLLGSNAGRYAAGRWVLAGLRDVGFPVVVALFVLWRIEPALRDLVVESTRQTALLELLVKPECRRELTAGSWSVWAGGADVCAELGPGAFVACMGDWSEVEKLLSSGGG